MMSLSLDSQYHNHTFTWAEEKHGEKTKNVNQGNEKDGLVVELDGMGLGFDGDRGGDRGGEESVKESGGHWGRGLRVIFLLKECLKGESDAEGGGG